MKIRTARLSIQDLSLQHSDFMFQLMNTPKWKEFIGDRNIQSVSDASKYIQKILDTPNADYWLIEEVECSKPIGIVTFMKRDYLDHFDIGFALLPEAYSKGVAFEATSAVLNKLMNEQTHEKILASTLADNSSSIKLLERLGFNFDKDIERNNEVLKIYFCQK